METFIVKLRMRAVCKADAAELLNDYTGEETDIEILTIEKAHKSKGLPIHRRLLKSSRLSKRR